MLGRALKRFADKRRLDDLVFGLGALLNQIAVAANGFVMPVLATKDEPCSKIPDYIHACLSETSRLTWLADIIPVGFAIVSVGDLFIVCSIFIPASIVICKLSKPIVENCGAVQIQTRIETRYRDRGESAWGKPW